MDFQTIIVALIGILSLGFGYLAHFLNKYLEKVKLECDKIKNEELRTLFENTLKDVEKIVDVKVKETEQLIAKDLREKIKDGSVSKDELFSLGEEVKEQVLNSINDGAKELLENNISNIEDFIKSLVEAKVLEIKK